MLAALSFLTPFGGGRTPDKSTLTWFPLVGALLGAALGGIWWAADQAWPPIVAAALVVTADLALTGMLHLDGLVDSADGLLPHLTRERRLDVMTEPTVGAFGIGVAITTLLLRTAALAAMAPAVLVLISLWCASRTAMAVAARTVPYARDRGLATAFSGGSWPLVAALGLVISAGAAAGASVDAEHVGPLVGLAAGIAAGAALTTLARRKIGGYTGDVLGAVGVVVETVGLLVVSARW